MNEGKRGNDVSNKNHYPIRVQIRHVGVLVDVNEFKELCSQITNVGFVTRCCFPNGEPRRSVNVYVKDQDSAQKLMRLHGVLLEGWTLDVEICKSTLAEEFERHVQLICERLGETSKNAKRVVYRAASAFGLDYVEGFVNEADKIYENGGWLIENEGRYRTLGGIFIKLIKQDLCDSPDRYRVFPGWKVDSEKYLGDNPPYMPSDQS